MDFQQSLYVGPIIVSALMTGVLAVMALRRYPGTGLLAFAGVMGAAFWWSITYVLELVSSSLEIKLFWAKLSYLGITTAPLFCLLFVAQYTNHTRWLKLRYWILLFIPAVVVVLFAWTNDLHSLIWQDYELTVSHPVALIEYHHGAMFWFDLCYAYLLMLTSLLLMLNAFTQFPRLYKDQATLLILGGISPWITNLFYVTDLNPLPGLDLTVVGFAFLGLIFSFALFRVKFLDLMPAAHAIVLKHLPDAVLVFDDQNRLLEVNPAGENLLNIDSTDTVGQPVKMVLAHEPEILDRCLNQRDSLTEFSSILFSGDTHFHLRAEALRNHRDRTIGWIMVLRDISHQAKYQAMLRERNRALAEAKKRAEETSRLKSQFVATVSHELRTPISNIRLYLDLLTKRPEKQQSYLETLHREAKRLQQLVDDILDVSRLDQDAKELQFEPIDVNTLVTQYTADREVLIAQRGHHVVIEETLPLPPVIGDANLLGRVFSNLLANAANYTPEGGKITVSTRLQCGDHMKWVVVSVADTGPGIPVDERERIFERFFRGKSSLESNIPGTGLGLAISKEIMNRHKGQLTVDDNERATSGSKFSMWLPIMKHR